MHHLPAKAKTFNGTRREIFDQDVCFGDQGFQQFQASGLTRVDTDALFTLVMLNEIGTVAIAGCGQQAGWITGGR